MLLGLARIDANRPVVFLLLAGLSACSGIGGGGSEGDSGDEVSTGTVGGAVYEYETLTPREGILITIRFPASGLEVLAVSDKDGLFGFEDLAPDGAFVLEAVDELTAEQASGAGSLCEPGETTSALLLLDAPGPGSLEGMVTSPSAGPVEGAIVTYSFPESGRSGEVLSGVDGRYAASGLHLDGTVVVAVFDPGTLGTASESGIVSPSMQSSVIDLVLQEPSTVHDELLNGTFTDHLESWDTGGPAEIVPRELLFESQAPPEGGSLLVGCPEAFAAIISTAGENNGVGSISQAFDVPPGYGAIRGRVRFLSNEWPEYFGSEYNDSYLVRVSTALDTRILAHGNLNSSSWQASDSGYNGAATEINFECDTSNLAGQSLTLHFEVRDVGDLIVDSALAIADVSVVRTESYVYAGGGVLTAANLPRSIEANLGQAVRFSFTNNNVLGGHIRVADDGAFGSTKESIVLPFQTVSFTFTVFGEEPMHRSFTLETISDALVLNYTIESTWIEGMPPNPCY